jgi:hypothetical protein
LSECARWLIFVEGTAYSPDGPDACPLCFWGENLRGLNHTALTLSVPHRAVFSPHVYGPATDGRMSYFDAADFPTNMRRIWREHWLGAARSAGATVVVGEWGGRYEGRDVAWADTLCDLLIEEQLSSFYWALNPNSGDTGGVLLDDWRTVHSAKQRLLASLPATPVAPLLVALPVFPCPNLDSRRFFRCVQPEGEPTCAHLRQACNGIPECADRSDEREGVCREMGRTAPCVTTGGADPLRPCALPFSYRGEHFDGCALDDTVGGLPWCPTELDASGSYFSFASWGECGPGCAVEPSRRLREDGCTVGGPGPLHCAPPLPSPPPAPPPAPPPPAPPSPPLSPPPSVLPLFGWLPLAALAALLACAMRIAHASLRARRPPPLLWGTAEDEDGADSPRLPRKPRPKRTRLALPGALGTAASSRLGERRMRPGCSYVEEEEEEVSEEELGVR